MLNTVLTVRAHQQSSPGNGWEEFTDAAIMALNGQDRRMYLSCGQPGSEEESDAQQPEHLILTAPHPSPLSAFRGFFGQQAVQQDKCISGESRDCPHRLADRLRKVLQFQ